MTNLVSTQWLAQHVDDPGLVILDASWHLPATKRKATDEFLSVRIPGARFFDLDETSSKSTTLPHMLPSAGEFSQAMSALGVSANSHIVCYDSVGLFSAARCWWMFKIFGHHDVAVLNGGLPKWIAENRPVESGPFANVKPNAFGAVFNLNLVQRIDQVSGHLKTGTAQLVDARSPTRFRGEEPEPRPGVRPGHMPGAFNLHYAKLLNADGTLKPQTELFAIFASAGVDLSMPVVTTCGSGVTAAIISLALSELGLSNHALYDGSWAEWGASDQAVETGT